MDEGPRRSGGLRDRVRGTASLASQRDSSPPPPTAQASEPSRSQPEPAVRLSAPIPDPKTASVSASRSGGNELDQLMDLWPQIRSDVKAVNRRIEALLQQADPAAVTETQVTIVSPYEFHRNKLNSDDVRRVVEDAISRVLARRVQVSFVSREEVNLVAGRKSANNSTAVEPSPAPASTPAVHDDPAIEVAPSPAYAQREVEERLTAARNIFDAEEIT
ncbi:MAG TPA: hypothetical protein VEW66_01535 [Thermomicrobiales bacterium]|nr:hypothetical protein [Thermomicrobiales bacterium]